ncbi:MAG: glycosyltransferase [Sphingobacteriaceae bacterium]
MTKRKKIFIVASSLQKGGAERVVSILCNYFSRKRHEVFLILLSSGKQEYLLDNDIQIIHLIKNNRNQSTGFFSRFGSLIATFIKLSKLLLKESPDQLISFTTTANLWSGIISYLFHVPFTLSERTNLDRTINKFHPIFKKLLYFLYGKSNAVVVPSKGLADDLIFNNGGQPISKLVIINNPVSDFKIFSESPVHRKRFILAVGRLEDVKGFDRLIDAFYELKNKDVDLIILGEGVERKSLTNKIQTLDLEGNVYLLGSKENVQDYYRQCELFVLSSRQEGYPNVLIEAMSLGCACVAFDCNYGPSEIIENNFNGVLVENHNIAKLSQSIANVLADSDFRKVLSLNAKTVGTSNSVESIINQWEKLLFNNV